MTKTRIYLDGKLIGRIRKFSIEFDVDETLPILKLDLLPEDLTLNVTLDEISPKSIIVEE